MTSNDIPRDQHDHDRAHLKPNTSASSWFVRILMYAVLGVAGYYVIAEHGNHLLQAWPLLFLAACPFLHFMHGGHGGHHDQSEHERPKTANLSGGSDA